MVASPLLSHLTSGEWSLADVRSRCQVRVYGTGEEAGVSKQEILIGKRASRSIPPPATDLEPMGRSYLRREVCRVRQ